MDLLAQRMKEAGMMSIEEMVGNTPLSAMRAHRGVTDLEKFEEWLIMRRKEFLSMQIGMTLDKKEDDEMYEWTLAHSAVFAEVLANFRQATGRKP